MISNILILSILINIPLTVIIVVVYYKFKITPVLDGQRSRLHQLKSQLTVTADELDTAIQQIKELRQDLSYRNRDIPTGENLSSFDRETPMPQNNAIIKLESELSIIKNELNKLQEENLRFRTNLEKNSLKLKNRLPEENSAIAENNPEIDEVTQHIDEATLSADEATQYEDEVTGIETKSEEGIIESSTGKAFKNWPSKNQPLSLKSILYDLRGLNYPEIDDLLRKIEQNSIDQDFAISLSKLYVKLYNHIDNKIVKLVERTLTKKFVVKITHALPNANYINYTAFTPIKFSARHSLNDLEKEKVKDVQVNPTVKAGLILKEISPQVEYKGRVLSQGKILIS